MSDVIIPTFEVGRILAMISVLPLKWNAGDVWIEACLGCNHELVPNASFLGPLAYEFLRGFVLTWVQILTVKQSVKPQD
jgi:hypothetical protein